MMRFTVFDRFGNQTGVLSGVLEAVHRDEVNGEDSLTLVLASCDLTKGDRIVWRDKFKAWHEHMVSDIKDVHEDGKLYATVYCENSIAELFTDYIEDMRPYNVSAYTALQKALSVTRWQVGTVDELGTSSVNFYHESAREAITDIIEAWGGELSTTIKIDGDSVSGRCVNITSRRGVDNGKRFEWSKDIQGITREVSTDDVCTALYGYGKGLETYDSNGEATGGYSRKLTFGSVNNGIDYVADEDAKKKWGLPDGKGGIKHAFGKVEFSDCEDAAELKRLTEKELEKRCQPHVTYTADVVGLADAGFEWEDVQAGDGVAIIDKGLGERLAGRALCVERYLYNEKATRITLGNVSRSIADVIGTTQASVGRLEGRASKWDGAASISQSYLSRMIDSLNGAMNKTGGYTYYEPGEGVITYDKPKGQNPTKAVQIKGAGIRIANSKTSDGDWNWRTFGTGDGFTADEINAGTIKGGSNYWNLDTGDLTFKQGGIYDSAGKNYWNLDTGEFSLSSDSKVGGVSASRIAQGIARNVEPFFSSAVEDGSYWRSIGDSVTRLSDGWAQIDCEAKSTEQTIKFSPRTNMGLKEDETYTMVAEVLDVSSGSSSGCRLQMCGGSDDEQLVGSCSVTPVPGVKHAIYRHLFKTASTFERSTMLCDSLMVVPAGAGWRGKVRIALYSGEWSGGYVPAHVTRDASWELSAAVSDSTISAYDNYLSQAEVLDRLTDGGSAKGIYLNDGDLYVNGDCIKSGSVDAGLLRAGVIVDKQHRNSWNLDSGQLVTEGMTAKDITASGQFMAGTSSTGVRLDSAGMLSGWKDGSIVGSIGVMANLHDIPTDTWYDGIGIRANDGIRVATKRFSMAPDNGADTVAIYGLTDTVKIPIVMSISSEGNGRISWKYGHFYVQLVNGIVVAMWYGG